MYDVIIFEMVYVYKAYERDNSAPAIYKQFTKYIYWWWNLVCVCNAYFFLLLFIILVLGVAEDALILHSCLSQAHNQSKWVL